MPRINAKHAKKKTIKSIVGRKILDVPNSFMDKAKPSDTPTKILNDKEIEVPVVNFDPNPGTTVLGMDFDDDFAENANQDSLQDSLTSEVKNNYEKQASFEDQNSSKNEEISEKPSNKDILNISDSPKMANNKKIENSSNTLNSTKSSSARIPKYSKFALIRKSDGEVIKITKADFVIGKSKYSDYQVTKNNTVSRSHVIAHRCPDGGLSIEDNNSKNGTFVDGEKLEPYEQVILQEGMSIRLSDEIFEVKKA